MGTPLNECNQWLHFWEISNFSHRRCEFLNLRIPADELRRKPHGPGLSEVNGVPAVTSFQIAGQRG